MIDWRKIEMEQRVTAFGRSATVAGRSKIAQKADTGSQVKLRLLQ